MENNQHQLMTRNEVGQTGKEGKEEDAEEWADHHRHLVACYGPWHRFPMYEQHKKQ